MKYKTVIVFRVILRGVVSFRASSEGPKPRNLLRLFIVFFLLSFYRML